MSHGFGEDKSEKVIMYLTAFQFNKICLEK